MALTLVTAASSNHFYSMIQLLVSVKKYCADESISLYVYDLGFTDAERHKLRLFLHNSFKQATLCRFPYEKYPAYFDISKPPAGQYAWKPTLIAEVAKCVQTGCLLWLDGGDRLKEDLSQVVRKIKKDGLFVPWSSGSIQRWTYSATISHMHAEALVDKPSRNAAIIGLDLDQPEVVKVLKEWAGLVLIPEALFPKGCNLSNHRYDQSLLSILYARYAATRPEINMEQESGIMTHQDCDHDEKSKEELDSLFNNTFTDLRVAIILCGTNEHVDYHAVYESIQRHIIDINPLEQFDFFIYSRDCDLEKELISLFQPKVRLFEPDTDPKMQKLIRLFKEYSERTGVQYDLMIFYRPDVLLNKDMPLEEYDPQKISNRDNVHFIMNQANSYEFADEMDSIKSLLS